MPAPRVMPAPRGSLRRVSEASETARTAEPRCYVGSEVGRLRRVMLHRPGLELQRLTPSTARELLFDGVLWVGRAREEHDAFAAALSSRGVEIVYLDDLLADVLEQAEVRARLVQHLDPDLLGPTLGPEVREWLMALSVTRSRPAPGRGRDLRRAAVHERQHRGAHGTRVRRGAASQHAVHARHVGVDLRRRLDQHDGDAGADPRVAAPAGRLRPPPDVHAAPTSRCGATASARCSWKAATRS